MRVVIGTSGWQYDDWRGLFYPPSLPKQDWLPYFSARFPSVEVNNTFYRLPQPETFASWRRGSADGFIITIKASRYLTHLKRLLEPAEPVRRLWQGCRRLGAKLGPVLFQLPPNFPVDTERLRSLLGVLPRTMRPAFEFRHPSWDRDDVRTALDDSGCALVLADRPGLRTRDVVIGGWSYVRFHQGTRLGPDYPRSKLRRWAARLEALPATEVFVYFNNDPGGAALRDAVTLTGMLEARGLEVLGPRDLG